MSPGEPSAVCRNCGRPPGEEEHLDAAGWCPRCRREVVRRATSRAWAGTALIAVVAAVGVVWLDLLEGRFVMFWLALAAGLLFLVFKIARRVAFEVVRARGVPPPEE